MIDAIEPGTTTPFYMRSKKKTRAEGFEGLQKAAALVDALEAWVKSATLLEGRETRSALKARDEVDAARFEIERYIRHLTTQAKAGGAARSEAKSRLANAAAELKQHRVVKEQRDRCRTELAEAHAELGTLRTTRNASRKSIEGQGFQAGERSALMRLLVGSCPVHGCTAPMPDLLSVVELGDLDNHLRHCHPEIAAT